MLLSYVNPLYIEKCLSRGTKNVYTICMRRYVLAIIVSVLGFGGGFLVYENVSNRGALLFEDVLAKDPVGAALIAGEPRDPITIHTAVFYTKKFFDQAYARVSTLPTPAALADVDRGTFQGMLVPHHLLAAQYIAQAFVQTRNRTPDTIILLSPDHFAHGASWASISRVGWDTPYGRVEPDTGRADALVAAGVVQVDELPFTQEHGVGAIMPFIRRTFPKARVIPIIVKDGMPDTRADALASAIATQMDGTVLLVGSFDFSHYLPQNVAQYHDATAQTVLEQLDARGAARLDIDSKPGLRVFLTALRARAPSMTYHPLAHTSADILLKNHNSFENTSYFTGYFAPKEQAPAPAARVTIHAFGDIMLDRSVRTTLATKGAEYPFQKIARFMDGSDIVLANLEGPFTSSPSKTYPGGPLTFTFDPKHAPTLRKFGVNVVSLANNHTLNFGTSGLQQTRQILKKTGIAYFGDPSNKTELSHIETVHGMRVGFVGFHQFINNDPRIVSEEIRRIRAKTDVLIVMPHWGIEYETKKPHASAIRAAHEWIDAGADVVIGAHPHVVQPLELYKGKMIFYSLGNFIFDQQFSEDVKTELSVGLVVEPQQISFHLFPMYNQGIQITVSEKQKRDILLTTLARNSIVPDTMRSAITNGLVTLPR